MNIRFPYARPTPTFRITSAAPLSRPGGIIGIESGAFLDASSMEAAMFEVSTVRSHGLRQRRANLVDALLAAAARGLAWLIAALVNELRVRRDMRQLAAMDDHMLKDIGLHRCEIEDCVRHGRSG
jgi:uncharacterized protein YjiS (DUF1127 family)